MDISDILYEGDDDRNSRGAANGRVHVSSAGQPQSTPFGLFDGMDSSKNGDMRSSLAQMNLGESLVARVFFGPGNTDVIQDAMRHGVYKMSGRERLVVGRQSYVELGLVMRSMFQSYGRNAPSDVRSQVRDLNSRVLDFCVPRVLQEARMYKTYLNDIGSMPVPLERGQLATSKGSRQNVLTRF